MAKKIIGACLSALVFIVFFLFCIVVFFRSSVATGEVPLFIFILFLIFFGIPLVGVVVALIYRIQEILEGEEEKAEKY